MQEFALGFRLVGLLAGDGQDILLDFDIDVVSSEACNRHGHAIIILADPLDIVGRIGRRLEICDIVQKLAKPIEADG